MKYEYRNEYSLGKCDPVYDNWLLRDFIYYDLKFRKRERLYRHKKTRQFKFLLSFTIYVNNYHSLL